MSRMTRGRIRILLAVPSAAALMLGATELLASPAYASRAPDCSTYCEDHVDYCATYPSTWYCVYCRCF